MIRLDPDTTESAHLLSGCGVKPDVFLFSNNASQIIVFSVAVGGRPHTSVRLSTGESLRAMKGNVRLYRGLQYHEDGERIADYIQYNSASAGDEDSPPSPSSYTVMLLLEERIFDQIVVLSQANGLPSIDLHFDYNNSLITFGEAPDGSEILWHNGEKRWECIQGFTLTHSLTKTL